MTYLCDFSNPWLIPSRPEALNTLDILLDSLGVSGETLDLEGIQDSQSALFAVQALARLELPSLAKEELKTIL